MCVTIRPQPHPLSVLDFVAAAGLPGCGPGIARHWMTCHDRVQAPGGRGERSHGSISPIWIEARVDWPVAAGVCRLAVGGKRVHSESPSRPLGLDLELAASCIHAACTLARFNCARDSLGL